MSNSHSSGALVTQKQVEQPFSVYHKRMSKEKKSDDEKSHVEDLDVDGAPSDSDLSLTDGGVAKSTAEVILEKAAAKAQENGLKPIFSKTNSWKAQNEEEGKEGEEGDQDEVLVDAKENKHSTTLGRETSRGYSVDYGAIQASERKTQMKNNDNVSTPPIKETASKDAIKIKKNIRFSKYTRVYPTYSQYKYDRSSKDKLYSERERHKIRIELDLLHNELFPEDPVVIPAHYVMKRERSGFFNRIKDMFKKDRSFHAIHNRQIRSSVVGIVPLIPAGGDSGGSPRASVHSQLSSKDLSSQLSSKDLSSQLSSKDLSKEKANDSIGELPDKKSVG